MIENKYVILISSRTLMIYKSFLTNGVGVLLGILIEISVTENRAPFPYAMLKSYISLLIILMVEALHLFAN